MSALQALLLIDAETDVAFTEPSLARVDAHLVRIRGWAWDARMVADNAAIEYIIQQADMAFTAPSIKEMDAYLTLIRLAARNGIAALTEEV